MEQKYAASAIIYNDQGLVLLARRASTKFPFPNVLSLPSTYLRNAEGNVAHEHVSDDEAKAQLTNAIKKKLSLEIFLIDSIGTKEGPQADYWLHMTDYFAKFTGGEIKPNGEDFSEAIFVDPFEVFNGKDRTKMGFCTQVLLQKLDEELHFWKKYFI